MLLILKILKYLKSIIIYRGYVAAYIWYACNAYCVEAWAGAHASTQYALIQRYDQKMKTCHFQYDGTAGDIKRKK